MTAGPDSVALAAAPGWPVAARRAHSPASDLVDAAPARPGRAWPADDAGPDMASLELGQPGAQPRGRQAGQDLARAGRPRSPSALDDPEPTDAAYRNLFAAMLLRAALDAHEGDAEAGAWLVCETAYLFAECLGIDDVWPPTAAQLGSVNDLKGRAQKERARQAAGRRAGRAAW